MEKPKLRIMQWRKVCPKTHLLDAVERQSYERNFSVIVLPLLFLAVVSTAHSTISVHVCAFGFMSTGYASFQWTELNGLYLADGAAVVNNIYQGEHPRYLFDLTLQYCFPCPMVVESDQDMQLQ
jgi:hypothetical protein